MDTERAGSAKDGTAQELLSGICADAAAGRLVGVMERYNVLEKIGISDCRDEALNGADQFVAELLMAYYNRKE